jgi:hypothetical protein
MGNLFTCCNNSIPINNKSKNYIFSNNPNKLAITIGINYDNDDTDSNDLSGCINDLNNINQFLLEKCNFCSSNVISLCNNEATKDNIESAIETMVQFSNNNENAELWFSFSGHGGQINSFVENDGKNEVIYPCDYTTEGYITDNWLNYNLINSLSENSNLFVLMDCCHSGTNLDLPYKFINDKIVQTKKPYKILANVVKISSCNDKQVSFEIFTDKSNGVLTNSFLETNDNDQFITRIKNINNYIKYNKYLQISNLSFTKPKLLHWSLYDEQFELFI